MLIRSISLSRQGVPLPRRKFNREAADKIWSNYTKNLIDSISDSEREGLEKGYSSYQIEALWQSKLKQAGEKSGERTGKAKQSD